MKPPCSPSDTPPSGHCSVRKFKLRDVAGGSAVRNPPSNAGDLDSIPGRGTKIPRSHMLQGNYAHALQPLSQGTSTREPTCPRGAS